MLCRRYRPHQEPSLGALHVIEVVDVWLENDNRDS